MFFEDTAAQAGNRVKPICSERGTATAIATLWLPLLLLLLGLASDWGRARLWRSHLQAAADAAALAAASRVAVTALVDGRGRVWEEVVRLDETAARAAFDEVLAANLPPARLQAARLRLTATEFAPTAAGREAEVYLAAEMETIFLRAAGRLRIPIAARAAARAVAP